jgi:hypothetical protein
VVATGSLEGGAQLIGLSAGGTLDKGFGSNGIVALKSTIWGRFGDEGW